MASDNDLEERLLARIRQSENVDSKNQAVAIAKSQGMLRQGQSGRSRLILTNKGRKAARRASETLRDGAGEKGKTLDQILSEETSRES